MSAGRFARVGVSDGNRNPLHYFYSASIRDKNMISIRLNDQFGPDYYYLDVTSPTLQGRTSS